MQSGERRLDPVELARFAVTSGTPLPWLRRSTTRKSEAAMPFLQMLYP
jgi:hypothetical protein